MAGQVSIENGKKGGRPKAARTVAAEMFRDYVAQQIQEHQGPIVEKMIAKAKQGDTQAFKELLDRAFGKAVQSVDLDANGKLTIELKKKW